MTTLNIPNLTKLAEWLEAGPGTGIFLPFGRFTAFETCAMVRDLLRAHYIDIVKCVEQVKGALS